MSSLFAVHPAVKMEPHISCFPTLAVSELSDRGYNQLNLWVLQLHKLWGFQLYKGENDFYSARYKKDKD